MVEAPTASIGTACRIEAVVPMTSAAALKLLCCTNFEPIQRTIDSSRVAEFCELMQADEFNPWPAITFALQDDGRLMLANGQHRLEAIKLQNRPIYLALEIAIK